MMFNTKMLLLLVAFLVCATANHLHGEEMEAPLGRHALGFVDVECPKRCKKSKCCKCDKFGNPEAQLGKDCTTKAGEPGECAGKYKCEAIDPCEAVNCGSCK